MSFTRSTLALFLFGSMCGLIGCGAALDSGGADALSEQVDNLGSASQLPAQIDVVTGKTTLVGLLDELPDKAFDNVSLTLHASRVSVTHDPGASQDQAGNGTEHHAAVTFSFSVVDGEACGADASVGPFELTIIDGDVTMTTESLRLGEAVRSILRQGEFQMCLETWADFDGLISVERVGFEFEEDHSGRQHVELCHRGHTITVDSSALDSHRGHGDSEDRCASGSNHSGHGSGDDDDDDDECDDDDDDDDDCDDDDCDGDDDDCDDDDDDDCDDDDDDCDDDDDDCDDDDDACDDDNDVVVPEPDVLLAADAGPDVTTTTGDTVFVVGAGQVLQGNYAEADLVFVWEQVSGEPTTFQSSSPPLTVETTGIVGDLTFRLTVSTLDGSVFASDDFVITVVAPQVVSLAAGQYHNVALLSDGTTRTWGWERHGQLGDGSLVADVASVDASGRSTLLAKTDGRVWTFGTNALNASAVPVQVPGMTEVVQVGALESGGLMLKSDGTVWGFTGASNPGCELGGATSPGSTGVLGPVLVAGLPSDVTSIATGAFNSVALDALGQAWVWGDRFGCTPTVVMSGVASVAAGESNHFLFLLEDGTVWGLGFNVHGELGNGTTASSFTVATEVVGLTNVVSITAGDRHSFFLKGDGTLWTAGWNHNCQLGLEDEAMPFVPMFGDAVLEPTQVGLTNVRTMAGGNLHSVAVLEDNTVWAWGANNAGQLSKWSQSTLPFETCTPMQVNLDGVN